MILSIAETENGIIKKSSLESVCYAVELAKKKGVNAAVLIIGNGNSDIFAKYGVNEIYNWLDAPMSFDTVSFGNAITAFANDKAISTIIMSANSWGKSMAGGISVLWDATLVSGVTTMATVDENITVNRSVYSGKAVVTIKCLKKRTVFTIAGNSYPLTEKESTNPKCEIVNLPLMPTGKVKYIKTSKVSGNTPLPEAEIVVSGGRGLKGPENWGILEELALSLDATLACSRPVADSHWRPHHEHVGQTGIAIHPKLYIAAGISGAIQHVAGVNTSKVIVVINKDPEAPFFKFADYGVIGDLFDVVPRLTAAIKKHRGIS